MASTAFDKAMSAAIKRLLYPLVKLLLRQKMPFGAFDDLAKQVYVDVADKEFSLPGRKQSVSRISVVTGLSRKEVKRVRELELASDASVIARYNRAARVVAGWRRDPDFHDSHQQPANLPLESDSGASFASLVKQFSGDMPARAVRDELVNAGTCELIEGNTIRLLSPAYVPTTSDIEKLGILGTDVADLLATIGYNITRNNQPPRFQRKVCYDNLPSDAAAAFQEFANQRAQSLLEEFDQWLAARDRDTGSPVSVNDAGGDGDDRLRAGFGIYYFEAEHQEADAADAATDGRKTS